MKRIAVALCLAIVIGGAAAVAGQGNQGNLQARVEALEAAVAGLTSGLGDLASDLANGLSALATRVTALEAHLQTSPIDVDCGAGGTVFAALQQARFRPGAVGIRIAGVCHEAVSLSRHATRLFAAAPGAGITSPNPSQPALSVSSARDVIVDGLTLTGGSTAMSIVRGGQAIVRNSVITGASLAGLVVNVGSNVELATTIVTGNFDGVSASHGSTVRVTGGRIETNTRIGIGLSTGSTVELLGGAVIAGNGAAVNVHFGAVLDMHFATIESNGRGISAKGASSVLLGGDAVIQTNTSHGLTLEDTSVAGVFGDAQPQIINNGGWGVLCSGAPAAAQIASGGLGVISGNAMGQTNCPTSPPPL